MFMHFGLPTPVWVIERILFIYGVLGFVLNRANMNTLAAYMEGSQEVHTVSLKNNSNQPDYNSRIYVGKWWRPTAFKMQNIAFPQNMKAVIHVTCMMKCVHPFLCVPDILYKNKGRKVAWFENGTLSLIWSRFESGQKNVTYDFNVVDVASIT
jgi:hypothetical protein